VRDLFDLDAGATCQEGCGTVREVEGELGR
jgi:hypothetical protein